MLAAFAVLMDLNMDTRSPCSVVDGGADEEDFDADLLTFERGDLVVMVALRRRRASSYASCGVWSATAFEVVAALNGACSA